MLLHDQMRDAVADVHADPDILTGAARTRGGRIRRRRRVATTGAVAAVGVLAVGIAISFPDGDRQPTRTPYAEDSTAPPSPDKAQPVPIDGRSTVAALREAVLAVADGETTAYSGQGGDGTPIDETYGELEFTPASGGGAGVVGVNVQPVSILDGQFGCLEFMVDCSVRELAGGDLLRTYGEEPVSTADGDGLRVVAELISTRRDLRVLASATNGFEKPANEWDVTREAPVLTIDQLAEVVTQDWWGFRLPARFADAGAELSPYEEREVTLYATPIEPAKP